MSLPVPQSESAFRRFLASVGIGAAWLEVRAYGAQHPRGTAVQGIVRVHGGKVTQHFSNLTVHIRVLAQGETQNGKVLASARLMSDLIVTPHKTLDFPFTLPLPYDARLTRVTMGGSTEGCILEAGLSPYFLVSVRSVKVPLKVTIARELEAILGAFRGMGFVEEAWFSHHLLRSNANEETTAVFRAPEKLREQLETVSLFMRVSDTHILGKAVFALRPHTLGSHVKGLVGGNRVEHPLFIPGAELLTPDNLPNVGAAMSCLRQLLSLTLALPDDPKSWMLRPSMSPPADPDSLLRPAMPTSRVSSDDLLRPTTPPEKTP